MPKTAAKVAAPPRKGGSAFAIGLIVASLAVSVTVFSYDPADPPGCSVLPANQSCRNLLGYPGAFVADVLFATLGASVYVLLAAWFLMATILLLRKNRLTWLKRWTGLVLLVPSSAVLAHRAGAEDSAARAILPSMSGGTLGACITHWLSAEFSRFEQVALVAGCLLVGLVLALGFVIVPVACSLGSWAYFLLRRSAASIRTMAGKLRPEPSQTMRSPAPFVRVPVSEPPSATVSAEPEPPPEDIPIHHHLVTSPAQHEAPGASDLALSAISEKDRYLDFELPSLGLLGNSDAFPIADHDQKLREVAALLEKTFTDFHLNVRVVGINTGPVITQYEVALETGLRLNKVTTLADDIALNLKVPSVRIVAPIPGKNTVGIEVPNEIRATVRLKEVIVSSAKMIPKSRIPLFLGKDAEGRALLVDLADMPHLLIAGRTGTGKSVCMNALILSILMTRRPDEVKLIMIDPKQVELGDYSRIPHLMHPIVKDTKKAEAILAWAVDKMEERYEILARARVRNIAGYNELTPEEIVNRVQPVDEEEKQRIPERMPYIVIIVDEVGDLMMQMKKEVEGNIIRLAQKSRAAGIHLVVATQKPTVDVITGLIKSNLPARICFQVSSRSDSRVVLDEIGADRLLGKGDMLFLQPGTSNMIRAQGTYASDQEIQKVVAFLDCDPCFAQELIQLRTEGEGKGNLMDALRERDPLYEQAVEIVIGEGRGSVSLLQRSLGIGYGRAARLIDFMAEDGIVGAYNGSSAREVLYTPEQWSQLKAGAA
jgi:S-DNA-T family DNA segregation ATPase FtsK/SpoIIIE